MRVLVGALLLSLCAFATQNRLTEWRSDEALFTAAVRVAPRLPRPALNLGAAFSQQGRWDDAIAWTERAQTLSERHPTGLAQQPLIQRQRQFLYVMACADPGSRSWCASS